MTLQSSFTIYERGRTGREKIIDAEEQRHASLLEEKLLVLFALADRAGFETGVAMRTMHQGHLSWGTYDDALGTHCNGHTNNMVVLSSFLLEHNEGESSGEHSAAAPSVYRQLVAPLDFDMAYFLWEKEDPVERRRLDPKGAEYLAMERNSMALCLGRMEGANSGCDSMEDLSLEKEDATLLLKNLVNTLRDVAAVGYTEGLRGVVRDPEAKNSARCNLLDNNGQKLAKELVAEALELTYDVMA